MNHKIVASLDITDEKKLISIAEEISNSVFAIKINWPTILSLGKSIIGKLSVFSKVICDLKIADIPNTNRLIIEQISEENPWAVIGHLFPGPDSMKSLVDNSGEIKIIGVASMSNPGSNLYLNPNFENLVSDAITLGCYGIVAPGNDYELLRKISRTKGPLKIFSPGVGAQGGGYKKAISSGSDYVIIGRSIYENPEPLKYIMNLEGEN